MDTCLAGVDLAATSCAMNDPSPFTLLAFLLATAKRRGVAWSAITGTSNQSDYLSHYVANHMFFRIALPGARRILGDHIDFCNRHVPKWNPMSVVGQHMQQAGATPAEAMAFTLATALQNADDCVARGMDPDAFLPRFTFFFDISLSFFEEIARFRAGRRIWARLTRERYGAKDPRSWRFKFHAQTSGVDLTRQQPLNNIARVTVQAMAGILGGLQSLHTDAYDEALSCPTEFGARIAVATQNILREEAHLTDVIDPLGGSYYVETLTDQMEAEILRSMRMVEDAGGMYAAVAAGIVQQRIGESARRFQDEVESGAADRRRRQRLPGRRRPERAALAAEARSAEDAGAPRRLPRVQGGALAGGGREGARTPWPARRATRTTTSSRRSSRRPKPAARTARSARRCAAKWASATCRPSSEACIARECPCTAAGRANPRRRPARDRARDQRDRAGGARCPRHRATRIAPQPRPRARPRHHRRAGRGQVDADQRAARRAARARPAHRGRRGRPVQPDHRRRGARRPRAHGRARRARERLHPLARLARPPGRPVAHHRAASSTCSMPPDSTR